MYTCIIHVHVVCVLTVYNEEVVLFVYIISGPHTAFGENGCGVCPVPFQPQQDGR